MPATLLLLTWLVACADDRKPVDETQVVESIGFDCLDDMGEIADDPLNPAPPPFCRIGVLGALQLDGRPLPNVAVLDRGDECVRSQKGFTVDLAPGVTARFHAAFQTDPDFVPVVDSPACPDLGGADAVPALPAGAGDAIEFATVAIVPATAADGTALLLPAQITARLIDAQTGRVRWQDRCRGDTAELTTAAGFPELANLRQVLSDEALRCARGFAATLGADAPV
jgi:hypothetical protein